MKKKQVIPLHGWGEKEKAIGAINRLNLADGWEIEIRPHVAKRSLDSSSLYWLWCSTIAKHISNDTYKYSKTDIHNVLRHNFLGYETIRVPRNSIVEEINSQLRSTADLDKEEMYHYMCQVDNFALEKFNLMLPTPEGSQHEKMKKANE